MLFQLWLSRLCKQITFAVVGTWYNDNDMDNELSTLHVLIPLFNLFTMRWPIILFKYSPNGVGVEIVEYFIQL